MTNGCSVAHTLTISFMASEREMRGTRIYGQDENEYESSRLLICNETL